MATAPSFPKAVVALGPHWIALPSLEAPRAEHSLTALPDGAAIVIGGHALDALLPLGSIERFDPRSRQWRTIGSLKTPRQRHASVVLNDGRVLVVGGVGLDTTGGGRSETTLRDTEIIDPATGASTPGPSLRVGRADPKALRLPSGDVWIVGGHGAVLNGAAEGTTEIFEPRAGVFREGPPLDAWFEGATVVGDAAVMVDASRRTVTVGPHWAPIGVSKPLPARARVLDVHTARAKELPASRTPFVGGQIVPDRDHAYFLGTDADSTCEAWLYDPRAASMRAAPLPPVHSPVIFAGPDDRVLAFEQGGSAAAWLDGDTWSVLPAAPTARNAWPVVVLADGSVLVAGGMGAPGATYHALANTELLVR